MTFINPGLVLKEHPQEALNRDYESFEASTQFINGVEIGREHPMVEAIGSGFGNDDRLMEQALDMEEGTVASRAVLEAQADRILRKLQVLERIGEDVYENDAVLLFKIKYTQNSTVYTFAALKAAGVWFVTGTKNYGSYANWDELIEYFTNGAEIVEMWMATDWENALG